MPFLKWIREQIENRRRKLLTMNLALQPRDNIDKLLVLKKGERALAHIEDSVDTLARRLEDYVQKRKEILITATHSIQ